MIYSMLRRQLKNKCNSINRLKTEEVANFKQLCNFEVSLTKYCFQIYIIIFKIVFATKSISIEDISMEF